MPTFVCYIFGCVSTDIIPFPSHWTNNAASEIFGIVVCLATRMGRSSRRYQMFIYRVPACPFHCHEINSVGSLLIRCHGYSCDRFSLYQDSSSLYRKNISNVQVDVGRSQQKKTTARPSFTSNHTLECFHLSLPIRRQRLSFTAPAQIWM